MRDNEAKAPNKDTRPETENERLSRERAEAGARARAALARKAQA